MNREPRTMNHSSSQWLCLVPLLIALAVNFNVLDNGVGWDDKHFVHNFSGAQNLWARFLPEFSPSPGTKSGSPYYRPIVSLSYYLDFTLWGNRPFGFHFSVWILHAINSALVFLLARRLWMVHRSTGSWFTVLSSWNKSNLGNNPTSKNQASPQHSHLPTLYSPPFIASMLFAVHPIHAEAVAWIAGRNDVFCTTFLLLSLWLYTIGRQTGRSWLTGFAMFAYLMALFTKETAVFFFLLFPLYEYFIHGSWFMATPSLTLPRQGGGKGGGASHLSRSALFTLSLLPLLITGLYFFIRATKNITFDGWFSPDELVSWSSVERIMEAFGYYFKGLFFPFPHTPFVADLPDSWVSLILSGIGLAVCLGGILYALRSYHIFIGIGITWMIVTLIPAVALAVFPLAPAPVAERYAYTPSVGFLLIVAWAISTGFTGLYRMGWPIRRVATAGVLTIIVLLIIGGWASWKRNPVWKNTLTFWEAAAAGAPESGFPRGQLGVQYFQRGEDAMAQRLYQEAIRLDEERLGPDHPNLAINLHNLADLFYYQKRFSAAESLFLKAIAIREKSLEPDHPTLAMSLNNLGVLYRTQGRHAEAETYYIRALTIREKAHGPAHRAVFTSLNNLAVLYHVQGRFAEAEVYYRRSLEISDRVLKPDHPNQISTLENYADLLRKMSRMEEAGRMERKAQVLRSKKNN